MAEKDVQILNFMKDNNLYHDYSNISIEELDAKLENGHLKPIERKALEARRKNLELLNKKTLIEKTNFLSEETKTEQRKQRIEEMKKEKEKVLHARKILVRVGIITLLATGSAISFKVYHDHKVKPIQIINENYDKIYSSIIVEKGQTLTDIAKQVYEKYPEEVKKIKSLNDVINEIVQTNHIQDLNEIRSGQKLIIPKQYIEINDETENIKLY